MAYKNNNYKPTAKSQAILDRAWEHINSVDYEVSARWLFYRLLQDGIYSKKTDYKKFLSLTSRARHNEAGGWRPDTLRDETRNRMVYGEGQDDTQSWVYTLKRYGVNCQLDKWQGQENYIEIWFEANAMISQFKYHTRCITLVPFGGMPSIPYKYQCALALRAASARYNLPVSVLYFGDYDPAGETIPITSVNDIRGWCGVDFDFARVGLNEGDAERYNIRDNPEHPGTYQWEALDGDAAGQMIEDAVSQYVNLDAIKCVEAREQENERALLEYLQGFDIL